MKGIKLFGFWLLTELLPRARPLVCGSAVTRTPVVRLSSIERIRVRGLPTGCSASMIRVIHLTHERIRYLFI